MGSENRIIALVPEAPPLKSVRYKFILTGGTEMVAFNPFHGEATDEELAEDLWYRLSRQEFLQFACGTLIRPECVMAVEVETIEHKKKGSDDSNPSNVSA